jgi:hypothetical protein
MNRIDELILELTSMTISSCTCLTKSNEYIYHKPECKYRMLMEVIEILKLTK